MGAAHMWEPGSSWFVRSMQMPFYGAASTVVHGPSLPQLLGSTDVLDKWPIQHRHVTNDELEVRSACTMSIMFTSQCSLSIRL